MGLQEGLQLAQWLLNLNRQGQIDRENKAYQDRIIQQQDEQRRQEMATNDAISAMLAGSGEANDMFTQLPSLQNQAKILGTLQATGGMFGGPFSMMGDASRAAYNATSEGVSSFAQNPVLSLARLGLEKGGSPLDVAKYAQAISGMDSPINRYQAEQAARAKDDKELDTFIKKEDYTYWKKKELADAEQKGREAVARINAAKRGEGGGERGGMLSGASGFRTGKTISSDLKKALSDYRQYHMNAGTQYSLPVAKEYVENIESAFSDKMALEAYERPGSFTVDGFIKSYEKLPDSAEGGITKPRKELFEKAMKAKILAGDENGVAELISSYVQDARDVFAKGGRLFEYDKNASGISKKWPELARSVENYATLKAVETAERVKKDIQRKRSDDEANEALRKAKAMAPGPYPGFRALGYALGFGKK